MRRQIKTFSILLVTTLLLLVFGGSFETLLASHKVPSVFAVKASEAKRKVTLSMVGDVLLHMTVENTSKDKKGNYNFKPIFTEIKDLVKSYDLAIVNQETILGGEELGVTGYPMFNAPVEIGDAIYDTGFDVVLHANNHALDRGKKGIINTLKFWRTKYPELDILGMYDKEEESKKIYVKEVNGIKIAILNYTYGTNGLKPPVDMPYAVNYLVENKVEADIKKARKKADFVIVCPHWGTEYFHGVSDYQKYWTNIFLKNKVDLVIGAHPHVIEPVEWVKDKKSGHKMLVYYSLGNFLNGTEAINALGNRYIGGMATVVIEKKGNRKAQISEYGIRALVNHRENKLYGSKIYELSDYSEKLAKKHAIREQHKGFSLKYCKDVCNQVWGKLWK